MGACAFALAAFEIAVGRRSAALAGGHRVSAHRNAARTARAAPFETRVAENPVESFSFRLTLDRGRPRRYPAADHDFPALKHCGGRAQVFDPAVSARADESVIDLDFLQQ